MGGVAIVEFSGDNVEILRANDRFVEAVGVSETDFQSCRLHFQRCFPALERKQLFSTLRSAAQCGGEAECELRLAGRAEKREPRWLRLCARYLAEGQGSIMFCLSAEDISKRMNQLLDSLSLGQRLADVVENLPYGIMDFCVSDKVELVYFSSRAAEMMGYTRQEFLEAYRSSPLGGIHPEDLRFFVANLCFLLKGEISVLNHQMRLLCRDGSSRLMRLVGRVVHKDSAGVWYVSTLLGPVEYPDSYGDVVSDLPGGRGATREIIPLGIMQYTVEGDTRRLTDFNDVAWQIFGYSSRREYLDEVRCKSKIKDTYPEDVPLVEAKIQEVLHTDRQITFEHRILRRNGTLGWVRVMLRKIVTPAGGEVIQCGFTDITEQINHRRSQ